MGNWEWDPFDGIINHGHFRVSQAGPLHAPVQSFALRRDEKLRLILETKAAYEAQSARVNYVPGTVRKSTEYVELENLGGIKAVLNGVVPKGRVRTSHYETGISELREKAWISSVEARLDDVACVRYTIDWLENVDNQHFIWPDSLEDETDTTRTRTLSDGAGRIKMTGADHGKWFGRTCVKLTVGGCELYLCRLEKEPPGGRIEPGCIIYDGTPDETIRERVRWCASFALGMYLVYLGSTFFDADWNIVSFKSVSAYSMGGRAFDLPTLPPAPLGGSFENEIDRAFLSRAVNGLLRLYDDLDFGGLSWAYWHAMCAPMHIAAVHYGAAIEGLQRRYVERHRERFKSKLVEDKKAWSKLAAMIGDEITKLSIPDTDKDTMSANVGLLNQVPRRVIMERMLEDIGVRIGVAEEQAWKRRHHAAHGKELEDGSEIAVIRETKLLRILLHRMVLRITQASDSYYDYYTLGLPIRTLGDPVPSDKPGD